MVNLDSIIESLSVFNQFNAGPKKLKN